MYSFTEKSYATQGLSVHLPCIISPYHTAVLAGGADIVQINRGCKSNAASRTSK